MITPILRDQFHASAQSISFALFIYGLPAKPVTEWRNTSLCTGHRCGQ
jgi:hypothetical protein